MSSFWGPTQDACNRLKVGRTSLKKYRDQGIFKAGSHWRYKFVDSPRSGVLYDLVACEQALINQAARSAENLELARV